MENGKANNTAPVDIGKVATLAAEIRKAAPGPISEQPGSAGTGATVQGELKKVSQEAFKGVGELLALPADAMYAAFEKDRWVLSEKEKGFLESKGSAGLSLMIETSPEELAKTMLKLTLVAVYLPRIIAELKDLIKEFKKPKEA